MYGCVTLRSMFRDGRAGSSFGMLAFVLRIRFVSRPVWFRQALEPVRALFHVRPTSRLQCLDKHRFQGFRVVLSHPSCLKSVAVSESKRSLEVSFFKGRLVLEVN